MARAHQLQIERIRSARATVNRFDRHINWYYQQKKH